MHACRGKDDKVLRDKLEDSIKDFFKVLKQYPANSLTPSTLILAVLPDALVVSTLLIKSADTIKKVVPSLAP